MGERRGLTKPAGGHVLPASQRKTTPIMVRLDAGQKALIDAAARRDDAKTGTWIRDRALKLARGWRLVPPGSRVILPDDE